MAGTRRGPAGSGRPTRAQWRPGERERFFAERLQTARTPGDQMAAALDNLRAVMADPHVSDTARRTTATQAVSYLRALATQLQQATATKDLA